MAKQDEPVYDDDYGICYHKEKYDGEQTRQLLELCGDDCKSELGRFEEVLKEGADPNSYNDKHGLSPLARASYFGRMDLVDLFLRYNADINMKSEAGYTALHWASMKGHLEVAKALLEKGAATDLTDNWGLTALIRACESGHVEVAKKLLEKGAAPDLKDGFYGRSALHMASMQGHVEVAKALLEKGAAIDLKDNYDKIPLDMAREKGYNEIVKLLEKGNHS